jgi:hypothetical protein
MDACCSSPYFLKSLVKGSSPYKREIQLDRGRLGVAKISHAASTAPAISRGHLPRDESREPAGGYFPERCGWCLGGQEFKQRMIEKAEGQVAERHFGQLRRETGAAKAERIINEELKRLGWSEAEAQERPWEIANGGATPEGDNSLDQGNSRASAFGHGPECKRSVAHGHGRA